MNKKVIDRIYIVVIYDDFDGVNLKPFTDEDKAEAYINEYKSFLIDLFTSYFVEEYEIPVYSDDTLDSIRERGCKALCNDYYREKWESWCLNREIERREHQ